MAQEKTVKLSAVAYEMLQVIAERNRQKDVSKYLEQFIKQQYDRIK